MNVSKLHQLISKHYPSNYMEVYKNEDTGFIEAKVNNKALITVLPGQTWEDIKTYIDIKIKECTDICEICSNIKTHNISCSGCKKNQCSECFILAFSEGKGIIVCPFCDKIEGKVRTDNGVKTFIKDIRLKLSCQ